MELLEKLREIPPVTRWYLLGVTLITGLCKVGVLTPRLCAFGLKAVFQRWEVWRLATTFLYFGGTSFLFVLLNSYQHLWNLEQQVFRGDSARFLYVILITCVGLLLFHSLIRIGFYSSSLYLVLVYIWSRNNPTAVIRLFFVFPVRAPYYPWIYAISDLLYLNNSYSLARFGSCLWGVLLSLLIGHTLYFLLQVYPQIAHKRRWRNFFPLQAPAFL